jgi:hypothetical protein
LHWTEELLILKSYVVSTEAPYRPDSRVLRKVNFSGAVIIIPENNIKKKQTSRNSAGIME